MEKPQFKLETREKGRIKTILYKEDLEDFLREPDNWRYIKKPNSWSAGARVYESTDIKGNHLDICLKCANRGKEGFDNLMRAIYEYGVDYYEEPLGYYVDKNNVSWLFTKSLEGSSLEDLEKRLLPKSKRFEIIGSVFERLKDLHSKKITHGDTQCQNIMYVPGLDRKNKIIFVDPKRMIFGGKYKEEYEKMLKEPGLTDYTLFVSTAIRHHGLIHRRTDAEEVLNLLDEYFPKPIPILRRFFDEHRLPAEWERENRHKDKVSKLERDSFQLLENQNIIELYNKKHAKIQAQHQLDLVALKLGGYANSGTIGVAKTNELVSNIYDYKEIVLPRQKGYIIIYYPFFQDFDRLPVVCHTKDIRAESAKETAENFFRNI